MRAFFLGSWGIKGTTIWSGGGGGAGKFGRVRLFLFVAGSVGKFISSQAEDRIFIFNSNNFFKKQKKKGGGG